MLAALRRAGPAVFGLRTAVQLAYLYGSVARSQALPGSDVDVAVVLARGLPPLDTLRLELELELALIDAVGLPNVDVRVVNEAPLLLQGMVVTEGILLFARDEAARVAYEASTRNRYFDYLPGARAMAATFAGALRKRLAARPVRPSQEWPA